MFSRSLVIRVLIVSFLTLALPLLIYSFIFFKRSYNEAIVNSLHTLRETATYRTFALEEMEPASFNFLKEMIYLLDLKEELPTLPNDNFNKKLQELTANTEGLLVFVVDAGKENQYKTLAANEKEHVGLEFLSHASLREVEEKERMNFLRFFYDKKRKKTIPYIYSAAAIKDDDSKMILGYLLVRKNVESGIKTILASAKEENLSLYFALLSPKGFIEAATDPLLVGQYLTEIPSEGKDLILDNYKPIVDIFGKKALPLLKTEAISPYFEFKWDDEMQLGALAPTSNLRYTMLAYTPKPQVFGVAMKRFALIYLIFASLIIFGSGITFWLSHWISRPLNQLLNLMKKVREGNLSVRYQNAPLGFEVNLLGDSFNLTLTSLLKNIQHAENERVKKETVIKEIEIGKRVQQGLLPNKLPQINNIELASTYFASAKVGGDFYDVILIDDNLFLICSDAAGPGISSCLYSLSVRSLIRSYTSLYSDLAKILALTNKAFCDDTGETGMFVTTIMGVFNLNTRKLSYCCAGHVPGLLRKRDGRLITLGQRGMALGLMRQGVYVPDEIELESGDLLLFYTDGLIDAENEKHQFFSEKRLKEHLIQRPWKTAHEVVEGLEKEIKDFIRGSPQEEEITILAMRLME